MKGDFSRLTFNAAKQYKSVLRQQGRVEIDADGNEQAAIDTYLREASLTDIIGQSGAPQANAGFDINVSGADLSVGKGHYYIDGILCENMEDTVKVGQQASFPGLSLPTDNGRYIVYLDAWDRLVTALHDDHIREKALNGPDTATRLQNIWQVRFLKTAAGNNCLTPDNEWTNLAGGPSGTMAARAKAGANASTPCIIAPDAGYQRLENQLYRVEIHASGNTGGTATFKWSRDNGSLLVKWLEKDGNNLRISSPNKDAVSGFKNGQWIELIDDTTELQGKPGTLVRIATVKDDILTIEPATATGSLNFADFPRNPKIRGWDSVGALAVAVPVNNDGWIKLEDGVEVKFSANTSYKSGDYWTVPARSNTGDVEWPRDNASNPLLVLPHGIRHHYARLAIFDLAGGIWTKISDCRNLFPPLTGMIQLSYVGGDAQTAMPDLANPNSLLPLSKPLQVGVSRGTSPVANARVEFSIIQGNGGLQNTANQTVIVTTGADGTASCIWQIDPQNDVQQVRTRLLDAANNLQHISIFFHARLREADQVSYDPKNSPALAGADTVQEAIDKLAQLNHGGCTTYVVTPGPNWMEILKQIKEGEDAHICFQRGVYETDETVKISGKGHLKVTGCGPATQIIASKSESALTFEKCKSLDVRDISLSSGNAGMKGKEKHLQGTLSSIDIPRTSIQNTNIKCAGGTALYGTCITVANNRGSTAVTPAEWIRIYNCDLSPGHRQQAILVVNAQDTYIEENRIHVAPKSKKLTFDRLFHSKYSRAHLIRQLVGSPILKEKDAAKADSRRIKIGSYNAYLNSSVSESEWATLVKANPPKAADLKSKKTAETYINKLIEGTVEDTTKLKSFDAQIKSMERGMGAEAWRVMRTGASGKTVVRNMLVRGAVTIKDKSEAAAEDRSAFAFYDDTRVSFNSPLPNETWMKLLQDEKGRILTNPQLLHSLRGYAGRIIKEEPLRNRFQEVRRWYDVLAQNNPAVAAKGIVCAGKVLGHVHINRNLIEGVEDAIHVGVSHQTTNRADIDSAQSVRIQNNVIKVRKPFEKLYGSRGIFVGNVKSLWIIANEMLLSSADPKTRFLRGIQVHGHMGRFISIRQNITKNCLTGISVTILNLGEYKLNQWAVTDNLLEGTSPSYGVNAPSAIRKENNVAG